jgi:carboxylate-amine ligase
MEDQRVTARDRYREMIAALRYPAHRVVVFGMHVHVAVGGGQKALQVIEALLPELPLLLALSTSSPFLAGEETGLASTRHVLGNAMPRTGLPPAFDSYEDYAMSLERLRGAGAMADSTFAWWDVRLHPTFGTIEVRIMDVQPLVEDAAAIAGLVQALVRHHGKAYDRGAGYPRANRLIVGENRWLAARHGLRAPLVHEGDAPVGARVLVRSLLDRVADDATALAGDWAIAQVADLLERGSSAERQVKSYRGSLDLRHVLAELAEETAAV